jgi:diguanylate cyclase (GGDEF)-like protein
MNRRSGLEWLSKQICGGSSSQEFIICYIDINNLKIVNDRYGHATGDDLIKTCCATISRQIDHDDVLFRLGGDEFIILFTQKQIEKAEQVWKNIESSFREIQKPYPISASHGFYHYKPGTIITVEEILELADREMYKDKYHHKAGQSLPMV